MSQNQELFDIEQEVNGIQVDLQSNTSTILLKPLEMEKKIIDYLSNLTEIERKILFFKKSNPNLDSSKYERINGIENKILILKNQIELNQKMLKKM